MTKRASKSDGFSAKARAFAANLSVACPALALPDQDAQDDLKRESAILLQALAAAAQAKTLLAELGFGYGAPDGYFCEMLKTEEQMSKIKRIADEKKAAAKASELKRKERHMKKFGKKVQTETLMERQKQKKEDLAKIAQLRKKRKAVEGADDFQIDVDSDEGATASNVQKKKVIKNGKKVTVERTVGAKRQYKNEKFGFGAKKWDSKRNTKDSTDNFDFNVKRNKKPFAMAGGKKKGGAAASRPGKQRRQLNRSKVNSKNRR